jgi:hypothetical protein
MAQSSSKFFNLPAVAGSADTEQTGYGGRRQANTFGNFNDLAPAFADLDGDGGPIPRLLPLPSPDLSLW